MTADVACTRRPAGEVEEIGSMDEGTRFCASLR